MENWQKVLLGLFVAGGAYGAYRLVSEAEVEKGKITEVTLEALE